MSDNAGGILLTDETGPTAFNLIAGNKAPDCAGLRNHARGITLAGHNPKALVLSTAPGPPTMTGLAPSVGGIYDDVVSDNTADGNGTKARAAASCSPVEPLGPLCTTTP